MNSTSRQRFTRWQEEGEKIAVSSQGAEGFLTHLYNLGDNKATTALLQHSEKRLQQIVGGTQRLITNQLTRLAKEDDALSSDQTSQHTNRHQVETILKETERIITGVCTDIEKYCFSRTTNWLNSKGTDSLYRYLSKIVDSYNPPLELLPEKSRNPLTPVRIIDNHFQISIPSQLRERVIIETVKFLDSLHQEINELLLNGCAPLFILCNKLVGEESISPDELPLPIKIGGEMPEFMMSSQAEERFAIIDKIHNLAVLLGKKISHFRNRRPLGEEYGQQLKKATINELPRWLGNYREQLKYAFLRHHLEACRELTSSFFIDQLASTEMALEHSEQLTGDSRLTTARKVEELKRIETQLNELRDQKLML